MAVLQNYRDNKLKFYDVEMTRYILKQCVSRSQNINIERIDGFLGFLGVCSHPWLRQQFQYQSVGSKKRRTTLSLRHITELI